MIFCDGLQGQAFNDNAETIYDLLVQYVGISGTGSNTVYRYSRSNNQRKCYLDLKVHEEKKHSKDNAILQSAHYDGNSKFTLKHYSKAFFQLQEVGPVYTFTEAQKINSFENGIKDPTAIKFSITEKGGWNKLPENKQTFDTYYNSMSESYGRLQSLVHPPGYRFTQQYRISQFNNGFRGRVGHKRVI